MTAGASLAEGFSEPTREAWRALVDGALKGADFDRRLVARTADGIALGPLDTAADAPAPAPPLWSPRDPLRPWEVRTVVAHPDPAEANRQALQDLQNGAASVLLRLQTADADGVAVAGPDDLRRVLDGVLTDLAPVALDAGWSGPLAAEQLSAAAGRGPAAPLAFHMDPLGTFARLGWAPGGIDGQVVEAAATAARLAQTHPAATHWLANGRAVHEAAGTEVQELGSMAAAAVAYVRASEAAGLSRADALRGVVLGVSVDGRVLLSTAKLRAARELWARIAAAFGEPDVPARIEARSSDRMLAKLDAWTNLVRLTAAGFAGAVGGADAVVLAPFTEPLGAPTDFARRQARNIQLVLQEEAHLGRVADPAAGAWSLERMTDTLARGAWAHLQDVERRWGGLAQALGSDRYRQPVFNAQAALLRDVGDRKAALVGVSEFATLAEAPVEVAPSPAAPPSPERVESLDDSHAPRLDPERLSAIWEGLRAQAAALRPRPVAYLAELGAPAEHGARAGQARNLLAAGGVTAEAGPPDAYDPAIAPVAVLCGSDEAYAAEAERVVEQLRARGARAVWIYRRALEHTDGHDVSNCAPTITLSWFLKDYAS